MAVQQTLKNIPETFEELAAVVFYCVVPKATLARRIDFVTDTYPEFERTKRASEGAVKVNITGGGQKCPKQWKKFLSSGENKTKLAEFLLK
jgi:hypothetical protein